MPGAADEESVEVYFKMMRFILIIHLGLINLILFIMYGADKRRAIRHKWRIPEKVLIGLAFAGGAYGAALGMKIFHHKTQKRKFQFLIPLSVVLDTFLIAAGVFYAVR